jgi:hypothetical protein
MREHDDYDDENIRLYTPVLQRVIILAAVIIAVPVLMWTITAFVRSYVARPKVPGLEHVASMNTPTRIPAISPAPSGPPPSPADQPAPHRVEGVSPSDAPNPTAETKNGPPNPAPPPDASASPVAANTPSGALQAAPIQAAPIQSPSPAIPAPATSAAGDLATGNLAPVAPMPRLPPASRSTDNAALTSTPSSSDRGLAWPNPNTTNPPDFAPPRLAPPPAPARTAAAEVSPADEPIRGPIPLPRRRPGIFAMAADGAAASGPAPLPRARPVDAPAEAATSVSETPYGYRPALDSDR